MDEPIKIETRAIGKSGKNTKKYGLYICEKHGEYWQICSNHKKGNRCPECAKSKGSEYSTEAFLEKFPKWQEAWDNRVYKSIGTSKSKHAFVQAECEFCHKIAEVRWSPNIVRRRKDYGTYVCPKCSYLQRNATWIGNNRRSAIEIEIEEWVRSQGYFSMHCRMQIPHELGDGTEIDIYLPEIKKGIEVDGPFHKEFEGSYEDWLTIYKDINIRRPGYHERKDHLASLLGITILHVQAGEWRTDQDKVKNEILEFIKGDA